MSQTLSNRLRCVRQRILKVAAGAAIGWGLLGGLGLLMACMWLDLLFELGPTLRATCGTLALLATMLLSARVILKSTRASLPHPLAMHLDALADTRGQILAGVDLWLSHRHSAIAVAPVTSALAQIAVDRAAHLADRIDPASAAPARQIWRPCVFLAALLVLTSLLAIVSPRLIATQIARFFDPYGDHPPFSRLRFVIEPGDTQVVYGAGVDIRAAVSGGTVDRVELVSRSDGSGDDVLPMFPELDGTWRATLANVVQPARYLVRARGARSRQFKLDVITVPAIENVAFRITPPAYTNRPPYEGALPQGGIAGLVGTVVEVRARSNRPLAGGTISLHVAGRDDAASTIRLEPVAAQANQVAGSFVIDRTAKLRLDVTDVGGQNSTQAFTAAVNVLSDERPFVQIVEPPANSFATPDALIEVMALAEDDYGVSRVQLYRALNESRARPTDLEVLRPPPTRLPAQHALDLGRYNLKVGDVIKLYARVEDTDPAAAKGSESPIVNLRIISQEEFQRLILAQQGLEALQSKYEQASRRLEAIDAQIQKLLEELSKADSGSDVADEVRLKIQQLAHEMQEHAAEVEKAATFELPVDLDRALSGQLKQIAQQMRGAAAEAQNLAGRPGLAVSGATHPLNQLRDRLRGQQQEFAQNALDPLEHLARILPLIEDQQRFVLIYEAQRNLEQRLDSLRKQSPASDPQVKARMRDMEAEQQLLRDELSALLDDIEQHVLQLPDDPRLDDLRDTAVRFASLVRDSPADHEMSRAQVALMDFIGPEAHEGAKEAADILESFLSKCQAVGGEGQACLRFSPQLAAGLGNSLDQLMSTGLGGGMGMGGGRGGFSMRSNSLANVGLYGSMPRISQQSGSGGAKDARGMSADGRGSSDDDADPSLIGFPARLRASGAAHSAIPPQYRQRVGEYFQRVADELGQ